MTDIATALIWDDVLATYGFGRGHPLNPRRVELAVDLIRALGLMDGPDRIIVAPRNASETELLLAHGSDYVRAVRRLSRPGTDPGAGVECGLGTEDVPIVEGMHEMARHVVGATLTAAEQVMSGAVRRAFSPAGGLHHAHRERASGFCVYNDLAVAIRCMQHEFGARVLYVDYDAHHGDGVQSIFYDDPDVLTVSIHESGLYLFPGTGFPDELGAGDGYGYSVNVPLEAGTEDASLMAAVDALLPDLADAFRPDVIVLQNGCDSHALDPLTHLRCTTRLSYDVVRAVCDLADRYCDGRVIATGGGGYAIHAVVPRAWALVWCALCGADPPARVPDDWLSVVRNESGLEVPATLFDPDDAFPPPADRAAIESKNAQTVRTARRKALPLMTGWGLGF